MEPSFEDRLKQVETKIDKIYLSVEKARRYALIHLIVALVVFALPILGLIIAIPTMLDALSHATIIMP